VYVVHGLNDENVKTRQYGEWWDELARNGVPRKIFLHQDVHIDSFSYRDAWVQRLHPWFDHWLQGLDNGVMDTPMATIQREDGTFTTEPTWPAAGTTPVTMSLDKPLDRSAGTLTTGAARAPSSTVTVTGRGESDDDWVLDPTVARSDRAVFLSSELTTPLRVSGTGTVKVRVQSDKPAAAIKARLVDYGRATRYTAVAAAAGSTCWGDGNATDTGCYANTAIGTKVSDLNIVTRTIANIGHYKSLNKLETLQRGVWYDLTFELNADDAVFAAGHRLGLVLTVEQSNPDSALERIRLTLDPAASSLTLPVTGSTATLRTAGPAEPVNAKIKAHPEPAKDPAELMRQFIETSR
jgi:X-Pro dipeptidyl-peptidase